MTEWISVDEDLPRENTPCLIFGKQVNCHFPAVEYARLAKGNVGALDEDAEYHWESPHDSGDIYWYKNEVQFLMPLPKPPRNEDD